MYMKKILTDSNIDGVIVACSWARWVSTISPTTIRCFNGGVCHELCALSTDTNILGGGQFVLLVYYYVILLLYNHLKVLKSHCLK